MLNRHLLHNIGDISAIHRDNDFIFLHNIALPDLYLRFQFAKKRVYFAWRTLAYGLFIESEMALESEANERLH